MAVVLDGNVKPKLWGLDPDLVAPDGQWFWEGARFVALWPDAPTFGADLSFYNNNLSRVGTDVSIRTTNLGPAYDFSGGVASYMQAADDASLDITGELTIACVFIKDAASATNAGLVNKYAGAGSYTNQRSYLLQTNDSGNPLEVNAFVSPDGTFTSAVGVNAGAVITYGKVHVAVFRYTPSVSLKLNVDNTVAENTTGIPSSIYSGTAPLWLGHTFDNTNADYQLNGAILMASVSDRVWSDSQTEQFIRDPFGPFRQYDDLSEIIRSLLGFINIDSTVAATSSIVSGLSRGMVLDAAISGVSALTSSLAATKLLDSSISGTSTLAPALSRDMVIDSTIAGTAVYIWLI
jgi:hypothetical protein